MLVLISSKLLHWDCQQQRLQAAVDWHATLVTTKHRRCPSVLCPAELPDVRTNTPVSSVTRDAKKRSVTVSTASGQKST